MNLFDKLISSKSIAPLLEKTGHFVVDETIGISLLTALKYKKKKGNYVLITSSLYKAQKIYQMVSSFLENENVYLFPSDELIRAESLAQSKEMVSQRVFALNEILSGQPNIVIANLAAASRFLPEPLLFKEKTLQISVGSHIKIDLLKKNLVVGGYSNVNKIDQTLQFAVRGDIIDIFSPNHDYPIRIELFDDEVESIRYFDISKQTSLQKLDTVLILPANDIIYSDESMAIASHEIYEILEKDQEHLTYQTFEKLRDQTDDDVVRLCERNINERFYKYFGLINKNRNTLLDYCSNYQKIFVDVEGIKSASSILINESLNYLGELHESGKIISHTEMYFDFANNVNFHDKNIISTSSLIGSGDYYKFDATFVPFSATKQGDVINIISSYLNDNYQIVIALSSHEQINIIQESLLEINHPYSLVHDFEIKEQISLVTLNLPNGFVVPNEKIVYLTQKELFNEKVKVARYDSRFKEATILKSFEDLQPGDYVVHEYQGIGQFNELQTLEVGGVHKDYLKIAYWGNDYLYVPLTQFQLVRKYLGKEGVTPRLSHLHSKDWENTKKRIKERINDLAERLMHLYIERSKVEGFAFQKDDDFQKQFDDAFEYELTYDQEKAIKEIKEDMEKPYPMDRLLCGDVGFGKTEVSFQAAFKAINSGKQVALLCPTTLLARQHYELALKRFAGFDIRIAIFSRLIPEKKQKEYISQIKEGKIHLAIGTHRLLSKEIVFRDLGLLIVDEEQRFGVEQKERLKELKNNIDVLTLSATPIPRTLQISLLGVRSLSRIDTPPSERMPIQTYVTPFRYDVAKELIERELGRNGQVFYLHNDIASIFNCAAKIAKMMPDVRIAVAHGRMSKDEIEDTMLKFYQGDIDVLVCTSIIENGIDVPNANMIIVEECDRYGLAQLYQIKGRVGRSDRISYAYLMYNEHKVLNEKAQKRLKAIQEFTELGSGYKIAQRDLMIRGAGDILGPEQAGFIDSIGLDMYIKLLNEAVKEKLEGQEEQKEEHPEPSFLSIDAYIPNQYAQEGDKIELYQEILSTSTLEQLAEIKVRTRDIYGRLPLEVNNLFIKRSIDLLSNLAEIRKMEDKAKTIDIVLGDSYMKIRGIGNILFEALIPYLKIIKVTYANNVFKIQVEKQSRWIEDLEKILRSLVNILETNKTIEVK